MDHYVPRGYNPKLHIYLPQLKFRSKPLATLNTANPGLKKVHRRVIIDNLRHQTFRYYFSLDRRLATVTSDVLRTSFTATVVIQ